MSSSDAVGMVDVDGMVRPIKYKPTYDCVWDCSDSVVADVDIEKREGQMRCLRFASLLLRARRLVNSRKEIK